MTSKREYNLLNYSSARRSAVKTLAVCFLLLVLFPLPLNAQSKPLPVGRRELRKYEATHPDEPSRLAHQKLDLAQLQREADELASLAQSIPPEVDLISHGTLPKEFFEKLKRIEKLSKHLRGELGP